MFGWFKKKLPSYYTPEKIFDGADPKFRWAAMDEDGSVYLHENKPSLRSVEWISSNSRIRRIICYGKAAAEKVWKESLMDRNDLLPAWYTPENVFKNAPEWANYAAIDSTGYAWWYENRPTHSVIYWTSVTGRSESAVVEGAEVDFGITQKNWKCSLMERPKKKEGDNDMNMYDTYWFIDNDGSIRRGSWTNTDTDYRRRHMGNCFNTSREAETALENVKNTLRNKKGEVKMDLKKAISPSKVFTVISGAPEWARWAAVDRDESLWYYSHEPKMDETSWVTDYRAARGYNPGISGDDWKDSKIKIIPKEARADYQAGDVLVMSSGEVLQYVHSDWFYGLHLDERSSVDFRYISIDADVNKGTIDAIYRPAGFQDLIDILRGDVSTLKTVYRREQVKEMTVAQIEKELGYSIKVVKEGE